jgi:thymidylate synthase
MSIAFTRPNCVEAWLNVTHHLLTNGPVETNVIVTIEDPAQFDPTWLVRFDPRAEKQGGDWIRDVMNTVFPQKSLDNSTDRNAFYDRYRKAHRRSKHKRWGTYFERLIRFGAKEENQLDNVIWALNRWKNNPHAALTIHLSSPETDSLRPLGAPCWHYGEFLCPDRHTIELVVVYRNHDYFNKALGNFLGLARLLRFVCRETGRNPGRLVCHSVRAYYDANKAQFQRLVSR